jgi:heme/copper-type cytochrome/quinol oxidase subunit 2
MMRRLIPNYLLVVLLMLLGGLAGVLSIYFRHATPHDRYVTVTAQKYAYDPPVLRINKGDRVHLRLASKDVTHGFYLEGYDLDARVRSEDTGFSVRQPLSTKDYQPVEEISFVANRTGKFRYRCSSTCGYMHPFMQGELIVSPNYLYSASVGLSLGLVVGLLWSFRRETPGGKS